MLPKVIKDGILSIEGNGFAGVIQNIELPKLAAKMEDYRAGGMNGSVELELGLEKMELSFEAPEQTKEILRLFGVCGVAGTRYRFNASAESEADCSSYGIEIQMTGRLKEIELGSFKPGDLTTTKYTVALATFKYAVDGRVLFDIDLINNIQIIDGKDKLEQRRKNLKL